MDKQKIQKNKEPKKTKLRKLSLEEIYTDKAKEITHVQAGTIFDEYKQVQRYLKLF